MKTLTKVILIIVVIVGGSYLAYNIKQERDLKTANSSNEPVKEDNKNETEEKTPITQGTEQEPEKEIQKDNLEDNGQENVATSNEEQQTSKEKQEEEEKNNIQAKAIEAVKKEWWGDPDALFTIDNSAYVPENHIIVKITQNAVTLGWYVVDTENWRVSEYQ